MCVEPVAPASSWSTLMPNEVVPVMCPLLVTVTAPLPWETMSRPTAPETPPPMVAVISPAPFAPSCSTMPLPVWPVMSPDVVSEMSPMPFWVTTMPLVAPVSVPVGVSTILPRWPIVPPEAVKSSASPLPNLMSASPVTVKVPPVDA